MRSQSRKNAATVNLREAEPLEMRSQVEPGNENLDKKPILTINNHAA